MSERTLIIIKPDGVQRRLIGDIIGRFEKKGLKIVAAKFCKISTETAQKHYQAHKEKYFFERAVKYISDEPVLLMVLSGTDAINLTRKMMGETFGIDAAPGTIRGDFGISRAFNIIHGSDCAEAAQREIDLYFKPEEIFDYEVNEEKWLI